MTNRLKVVNTCARKNGRIRERAIEDNRLVFFALYICTFNSFKFIILAISRQIFPAILQQLYFKSSAIYEIGSLFKLLKKRSSTKDFNFLF
jgi:hypothetical protein